MHALLDGKASSPSACTLCPAAKRFRRPHARFARRQSVFAIGMNALPGGKTLSPSACTLCSTAKRFRLRHARFVRRQNVFAVGALQFLSLAHHALLENVEAKGLAAESIGPARMSRTFFTESPNHSHSKRARQFGVSLLVSSSLIASKLRYLDVIIWSKTSSAW